MIAGDFNGHVGQAAEGYERLHGGYGFGDRNREGEMEEYWTSGQPWT